MNKLTTAQKEKLIDLIKEKPFLYNKADKNYKQTAMKERIWKDISEYLGVDENDCKTAWKSLRDQFVKSAREMRVNAGIKDKKAYKYYDQLSFLNESLHSRKRACNYDNSMGDLDVKTMFRHHGMPDPGMDVKDSMNEMGMPSTSGNMHMNTPKRYKNSWKDDECLREFLMEMPPEIKSGYPQGDIEPFFLSLASMVKNANLSAGQTRHVQRRLLNLVADELDKFDTSKVVLFK